MSHIRDSSVSSRFYLSVVWHGIDLSHEFWSHMNKTPCDLDLHFLEQSRSPMRTSDSFSPGTLGRAPAACCAGRTPWSRWHWWQSPSWCPARTAAWGTLALQCWVGWTERGGREENGRLKKKKCRHFYWQIKWIILQVYNFFPIFFSFPVNDNTLNMIICHCCSSSQKQ